MLKSLKSILLIAIVFAMTSQLSIAQSDLGVVGKLFDKKEADELFGPVLKSVQVKISDLQPMLEKAGDYVMFGFDDKQLLVADSRRDMINNPAYDLKSDHVMFRFSKSKVYELLSKGGEEFTTIEMRGEVLSLTNGTETLEAGLPCPPMCD
jgi:hypothetical protein